MKTMDFHDFPSFFIRKSGKLRETAARVFEHARHGSTEVIGFFGDNQITLRGFYTDALGELVIQVHHGQEPAKFAV